MHLACMVAAAAVPADPVPHIQAGVALGANSEVLQANVKAFGTTSIKGISHLVRTAR